MKKRNFWDVEDDLDIIVPAEKALSFTYRLLGHLLNGVSKFRRELELENKAILKEADKRVV
jgi:hypothetical protein